MIAKAPGKVVLSGAYAVLEGAPALVTAVDRYAVADANRSPNFVTPEVEAAVGADRAVWFDAAALRHRDQKLGLGSSAAILVASLAALHARQAADTSDAALASAVFEAALLAHRKAQGGGSGIDVAASTYGGHILAKRSGETLLVRKATLPEVHVEVWAAGTPASTADLLAKVRAFATLSPADYRAVLAELTSAALAAEQAVTNARGDDFIQALGRQLVGLTTLGEKAGASIVTEPVRRLARAAALEDAVILPAGAGGGDIVVFVGARPPSPALYRSAVAETHEPLALSLGARGVHVT